MNPHFGSGTMLAGGRMMDSNPFLFGGFGVILLIGAFVLVAIVIGLIVWAVARKPRATAALQPGSLATAPAGDTALAIARERLARGEIEPEQYTAIVAALHT